MQKRLGHGHDDGELWYFAGDRHRIKQPLCTGESRRAVDAQRLVNSRDHKEQANGRVLKQILQRIQPIVSWPIGDGQVVLVEHMDKTRRITARTDVHAARGMNGADHHEWRSGDEVATMCIDPCKLLGAC